MGTFREMHGLPSEPQGKLQFLSVQRVVSDLPRSLRDSSIGSDTLVGQSEELLLTEYLTLSKSRALKNLTVRHGLEYFLFLDVLARVTDI